MTTKEMQAYEDAGATSTTSVLIKCHRCAERYYVGMMKWIK